MSDPFVYRQETMQLTQVLLDSYRLLLGSELCHRTGDASEQSMRLFCFPKVVVAHGTQSDPILCYANQAALELWETDMETLLRMPSRKTAEPQERSDRAACENHERTGTDQPSENDDRTVATCENHQRTGTQRTDENRKKGRRQAAELGDSSVCDAGVESDQSGGFI